MCSLRLTNANDPLDFLAHLVQAHFFFLQMLQTISENSSVRFAALILCCSVYLHVLLVQTLPPFFFTLSMAANEGVNYVFITGPFHEGLTNMYVWCTYFVNLVVGYLRVRSFQHSLFISRF